MAERLTEFVTKNCSEPFYRFNENSHISVRYRYCANIDKAINKLGKLEDILEKHGIKSVEELNKLLSINTTSLQNYYTLKETANIFNVYWKTIRNWVLKGKIKAIKIGKEWKIPKEEINRIKNLWEKADE